jgi:hypothetical protein
MQYITGSTHPLAKIYHDLSYRGTADIKEVVAPECIRAITDPSSEPAWKRNNQRELCGCELRLIELGDAEAMEVLSKAAYFRKVRVAEALDDEELKAWFQIVQDALHHSGRGHPTIGFLLGEAFGELGNRHLDLPQSLREEPTTKKSRTSRVVGLVVLGGLLLFILVVQDRYNPWFRIWSS